MKCPDCKGEKGKWQHTHSSLDPINPHVFIDCETCGGTGEVDKIQEELAEYAHKQWSGWMEYLFSKCINYKPADVQGDSEALIIPQWAVTRWQKQIETSYKDLSEEEKTSDRSEADGMIEIFKAADILPTEKVCPECGGTGEMPNDHIPEIKCSTCKGKKIIPLYYTPEQYEKIMGKPYPKNALVWFFVRISKFWQILEYSQTKVFPSNLKVANFYIVQTAQPAPPANYRPEE